MPSTSPHRAFALTAIAQAGRLAALLGCASLAACTWNSSSLSSSNIDYRNGGTQTAPLDVPPDLSQLGTSRYQNSSGVVSASSMQSTNAGKTKNATAAATQLAARTSGSARIERGGNQRWIASTLPADQVWPLVHAFWLEQGFKYSIDQSELGILETEWSENRAKLPKDVVRNTLGGLINSLSDTGERDRFRTRIERTAQGTDIFISHSGVAEVVSNGVAGSTHWETRPNDPSLEAEMLGRLMLALGGQTATPQTTGAAVQSVATAPAAAPRARLAAGSSTSLQVDDDYDRAWRRVGLALDRGGFTVEDRDRTQGMYFVRYVDPTKVGQGDPGFFARLFGAKPITADQQRYRIALTRATSVTTVSVVNNQGQADNSDAAQRIARLLVDELK
ncbi:outer membrane protein assembly factor BamC [Aquabacterium sp.]|uniref:outer membrane protein assembly factor BamC n=1 Tax=Aquabacterium sp. TaxID=1872578 RepID=UPI0035AE8DCD